MYIAILTDLHLGARNDSLHMLEAQEKFYQKIFFPELRKRGIKTILNLGDTFDRRKIINFQTLARADEFFFFDLADFEYHAVVGNHDTFFANVNETNSPSLLQTPQKDHHIYVDDLEELEFDGLKIAMCPWLTRTNKDNLMEKISKSKASILMGHFAIEGFEMMKGRLCEGGLDRSIFKKFDAVYSGHFHHGSVHGNIRYLGAPYEMTWSDYKEPRGFWILDTKTRDLEFVKNPYRLFYKLNYDDSKLTAADLANMDFSMLAKTYVKLVIKIKSNEVLYEQFMTKLQDSGLADLKVLEDSLDLESVDITDDLDDAKDTVDILNSYIDEIPDLNENKNKKLKTLINNLYQEALEIQ